MRLRSSIAAAAAALVTAPAAASAQPACAAGTLQSYVALGAAGCYLGSTRVYGFARSQNVPIGVPYEGAFTITPFLTELAEGTRAGFEIAYAPAVGVSTTAVPTVSESAALDFTADFGVGLRSLGTFTALDPADVVLERTGDKVSQVAVALFERLGVNSIGSLSVASCALVTSGQVCFGGGVTPVAPRQVWNLVANSAASVNQGVATGVGTGTASVSRGQFGFVVAGTPASVVPEPATFALAGVGGIALAGAGAMRRRRAVTR